MQIPIVATDIRGIRNSVRDGKEALLVPVRDSKALARALQRLIEEPQLADCLKLAARRRFVEEFTEEKMVAQVWQVYQRLASDKGLSLVD